MDRRTFLVAAAHAGLSGIAGPVLAQQPPRVVFLNPGESVERGAGPYWRLVAQAMTRAASTLGMRLEILYGERDHLATLRQAEQVAQRTEAPDYLIIVNEKLTAGPILKLFAGSRAKIFLIHNDLTPEQRQELGNEREKIANWIGTMTSDSAGSGYLIVEYLYSRLRGEEPRIIGITGDPQTPVARERAEGAAKYVARAGRGRIYQVVYGDWTYADGEQKASVLLSRYPDTNLIWAANDSMAMGALRAVQAKGARVLVGGGGGWPDALKSIAEGGLTASAAGNFTVGAWVMVLLHDYHHGHDFTPDNGVNLTFEQVVVHRQNVQRYEQVIFKGMDTLDVRPYSKVLQPRPGPYRFSLEDLVAGPKTR